MSDQSLHRKLFLARKASAPVTKKGESENGDYYFARFEDVLAEAAKQLEKRDILIVPEVVEEKLAFSARGFAIATVVMRFEVVDTKGDESIVLRWSGTGHDSPGDKAAFKAQTGCEKYFLAKLLGIPFGTDPEAVEPTPGAPEKRVEENAPPVEEPGYDHDRGRRIQEVMDERELSAILLAPALGVQPADIYDWRAGRPIPFDKVVPLANELSVLPSWLSTGEGAKVRHERPLPESDLPEPDWTGLTEPAKNEVGVDA